VKPILARYDLDEKEMLDPQSKSFKFFNLFSMTTKGVFNPLCAFMGGFVA